MPIVLGLTDQDADREHRLGHGQGGVAPARAFGQNEAGEVGARLRPRRPRPPRASARRPSPAAAKELGELRAAGSIARMSAEPTRIASAPASSAAAAWARLEIPLSATTIRSRGARQTSSSCAPGRSRTSRGRARSPRRSPPRAATARSSSAASCASTRTCRGPERAPRRGAGAHSRSSTSRRRSSAASAPALLLDSCSGSRKKPFARSGAPVAARAAAQVGDRAAEALVHEHRDCGRAGARRKRRRGQRGRRRAAGRRPTASAASPRRSRPGPGGECVRETAASGDGYAPGEKTASASSRTAAAPESTAARAIS